jgi:putative ABC transport system substrate-binding protein
MGADVRRREFVTLLGGAAAASVAWPLVARAQQPERMRRIGVLLNLAADDPEIRARLDAFLQGLQELRWSEGRNLQIDYRWGVGDTDRHRINAAELVALAPDVILAHGSTIMGPLQRATRTVPIVFVSVSDPVAGGFVASLARPGGNATGFTTFEYGMSAKWLELLRQIAPRVKRAAVIRDPGQVSGGGQLGAMQAVAPSFGVELSLVDVRDAGEIERAVTAFARQPNGGLIVTTTALAQIHRDVIVTLAARHRLPAVYPYRLFVTGGGLISYGPDTIDQYRRAAGYVDRILKGEKPADLAVQAPTKYELAINLKTAKTLGLDVPPTLLARADEVIE